MGGDRPPFDADLPGTGGRARAQARAHTRAHTRHERRMRHLEEAGEPPAAFAHVALEAQVRLRAPLFATEQRGKVEGALRALFPDAVFEGRPAGDEVVATARDLTRLAEILRHQRIRDTARSQLVEAAVSPTTMRFRLNKQAACAARVNFVTEGEVLGAIEVELESPSAQALAEELTWIEGESDERLFGTKLHALPPKRRPGAGTGEAPGRPGAARR